MVQDEQQFGNIPLEDTFTDNQVPITDNVGTQELPAPEQQIPVGDPQPKKSSTADYLDAANFFEQERLKSKYFTKPGYETKTSYFNDQATSMFLDGQYGFEPSRNSGDFYGELENPFVTLGKGTGRLVGYTGAKIGQGAGFLIGLANPQNWDKDIISKAADTGIAQAFNELEEDIRTWLPTYQELEDKEKGFFHRLVTDGDLWMEDVVDATAFVVSAWVPGLALSKLNLGAKLARGLSMTRAGATSAEAAIEGAAMAERYLAKAGKVAQNMDRYAAYGLATASEAMFEASEVKKNVYDALSYDERGLPVIDPTTGEYYTEDKKRELAGEAARNTFLFNAALLAGTNLFELQWVGKFFNKSDDAAKALGIKSPEDLLGRFVKDQPTGRIGKFFDTKTGAFLKGAGTGIAVEGYIEENMQLAIQRVNERYGSEGRTTSAGLISDILKQYAKQTYDATLGNDQETATNIGLGGLLGVVMGGVKGASDYTKNKAFTDLIINNYNRALDNRLKFSDVYKKETITTKDENGVEKTVEKYVRDEKGNLVFDTDKVASVLSNFNAINSALAESDQLTDEFKVNFLKDNAFKDLVLSSINAGMEKELLKKLADLKTADKNDILKLGFVVDDTLDQQINRYQKLASKIIDQNKIINSDILLDGSKEDKVRKARMIEIAANQAVYKSIIDEMTPAIDTVKNNIITADNSSLSDGLVDQLNEAQMRINSQKEYIDSIKGPVETSKEKNANEILKELQKAYDNLLVNNEMTLKDLKKDENGFYQYQKEERNQKGINDSLNRKLKLRGELQNEVRNIAYEWASYADTVKGKENFTKQFQEGIVTNLVKAAEEQLKQAQQLQEQKSENEKPGKKFIVSYVDKDGKEQKKELQVGETYVGKLSKSYRFRGDKKVSLFNNDRIKIISVSPDGKTVNVKLNNNAALEIDSAEIAEIAISEKWVKYKDLTNAQKWYLHLRNFEIEYKVPVKNKQGKWTSQVVTGRVQMDKKDRNTLLFVWVDKAGKKNYIEYNSKWQVNKKSLTDLPDAEKKALLDYQKSLQDKMDTQVRYLSDAIRDNEEKLAEIQKQRDANAEAFEKLKAEIEKDKKELEKAVEFIRTTSGRGSRRAVLDKMKQLSESLSQKIAEKEQQLAELEKEKEQLKAFDDLFKELTDANNVLYQGLFEIDQTGSPFLRDDSGSLTTNETRQVNDILSDRAATEFVDELSSQDSLITADRVQQLADDTKAELDLVTERITYLKEYINYLKQLVSKVSAFQDVTDALLNITDREQLRNALKMIERQIDSEKNLIDTENTLQSIANRDQYDLSTAIEKEKLVKAIRKGLARGDKDIETQILLEALSRLTESVNELNALNERYDVLSKKLPKVQKAAEQERELSTLNERIDLLYTLRDLFTARYKEESAKKQKVRQAKASEVLQSQLTGDQSADVEIADNKSNAEKYNKKKPKLSQTGLFTTAGKHYVDDKDTEVNTENNNHLFFKLSTEADLFTDEYYLMPVTAANDDFGIRREDVYKDDIKLIVVKKVGDEYRYVNQYGEVLENPTKESLVYTSMHGNATMFGSNTDEAINSVKNSFTTDDLKDSEVYEHIKRLKTLRERIKQSLANGEAYYLKVNGKSKGIPVMLPNDVAGQPQELELQGRLIAEDSSDFKNLVHPDGQAIEPVVVTSTERNLVPHILDGRVVMLKRDGTFFRVFNRQLSQEEKDNLIAIFKKLSLLVSKQANDPNSLTAQDKLNLADITTYLNGTIFWTTENKESDSENRFYIGKNGMLYRGSNAFVFTPDQIEANKEALVAGLYHQVNNKLLKSNEPFLQVIVGKNGEVKNVKYNNYTEYLLSQNDADGKSRLLGAPVIHTNAPTYVRDSFDPQLKQVYFTFNDPVDPYLPKTNPADAKEKIGGNNRAPGQRPATGGAFNFTGNEPTNTSAQAKPNNTASQRPNATTNQRPRPATTGQNLLAKKPDIQVDPQTKDVIVKSDQSAAKARPQTVSSPVKPTPADLGAGNATPDQISLLARLSDPANRKNLPSDIFERQALAEDVKDKEDFKKLAEWFNKNLPQIPVNKVAQLINNRAWGAFIRGAVYIYQNAEIGTGYHEAFEAVWNAYLTDEEQVSLAQAFRSIEGTFYNPFTKETKKYSEASFYDVREVLAEQFREYVLNQDTSFTGKIAQFFKDLWNFIKSLVGLNREPSDIINKLFKDINKGKYANMPFARHPDQMGTAYRERIPSVTQEMLSQVVEGLTSFFFINLHNDKKNLDTLIDKTADTSELLKKLFIDSWELLTDHLIGSRSEFYLNYVKPLQDEMGRELTQEEAASLFFGKYTKDNRLARGIMPVLNDPAKVYEELKLSLRKFGIDFGKTKEQDEDLNEDDASQVSNKEEDVSDSLGIRDTMSIDPRRLTAINFRMRIGSLTDDMYSKEAVTETNPAGIVYKKNGLGLPKLVDFDSVHLMLINELNSTVSQFRDGKFVDAFQLMFEKLDKKYKMANGLYRPGYVWIERLKRYLNYKGQAGEYFRKTDITQDDIMSIIGFEKSLMNQQNIAVKTIVAQDGLIYDFTPISSNNDARIRDTWENNVYPSLKSIGSKDPNSLLGVDDNGDIVIDRDSYQFKGNPSKPTEPFLSMNPSRMNFTQIITNLKNLGITFSASEEDLKKYNQIISKAYGAIQQQIMEGNIRSMKDLFSSEVVNSKVKDLINIETQFTAEDNVLMHMTASGKPQYSISLPSNISYLLSSLNQAQTLADFVRSNPQFGTVDGDTILIHPYHQRSLILKPGGLIFDEKGKKKPNTGISYHLISGMSDDEVSGTDTSELKYPDRVTQEIHYLLKDIHYTIINSDKSSEFALGLNKPFVTPRQMLEILSENSSVEVLEIYMNQLEDEVDAAIREKQVPSNIQYYSKQVLLLGHFKEILGFYSEDEIKKKGLVKSKLQKDYENVLAGNTSKQMFLNKPEVKNAIAQHFKNLTDETFEGLVDLDILKRVPDENGNDLFYTNSIDNSILKSKFNIADPAKMSLIDAQQIALYLAVTKEIAVTEQHKLIYGHPAMFKDLAKRANGANSTKDAVVDNYEVIRWMDQNMPRVDGKSRSQNELQTFKNISFKDNTTVSTYFTSIAEGLYASLIQDMSKDQASKMVGVRFDENGKFKSFILDSKKSFTGQIKSYIELNEADAQGWIMPDMWRDMLFLSSKIDKEQLAQWEYEKAYEIVARSKKPKSDPAYKAYDSNVITAAQEVLDKGNPGAILQTLKPQYFGYANNKSLMQTVFLKHSVQPKFYRHVEGSQFERLYIAAQSNQVDIIGFESGQKVGNMLNDRGEFLPIYNQSGEINVSSTYDDDGKLVSTDLPADMPIQELYTRYYGIQQEVPNVSKRKVVRGTQVTKLIMSNFTNDDGEYTSEEAASLIKQYNDTIVQLIRVGKAELLEEFGIEQLGDGSYITKDVNKMINLIREELVKRDLPNNMIDGIQATEDGQSLMYKFDTLVNHTKIDNLINAIIDSRVISDKMFGKASVQVASTGYEFASRKQVYLDENGLYQEVKGQDLTDEQKKSIKTTSSDLKFYRLEDGKIAAMEVYIPWFFEGVSPQELGLKLVNGVYKIPDGFDKKLLEAVGFRIPTQGMNSIENIVIKGFLPKEAGDLVVVPSEIVGKSGSDFDIDKLNIYLSNYAVELPAERSYDSDEFKEYLTKKLQRILNDDRSGFKYNKEQAEYIVNYFTKDHFDKINRSNYTIKGMIEKGGKYALEEWIAEETTRKIAEDVKGVITSYNAQVKNAKKKIVYIEAAEDSKAGLQNKLKETMQGLISLPENYRQLLTPNGAETLKDLRNTLNDLKGKENYENSMLALRKFIPMSEIRERYLASKRMVGIAALQQTSHTLAQIAGLRLTGQYDANAIKYLFDFDENADFRNQPIVIKLKHNRNSKNELYLYAKKDKDGRWISELISEELTGFVDAAKDPFVFELNLTFNTAATWFYLQKLGVPVTDIAYLFNQPIVEQYIKTSEKNDTYTKRANSEKLSRKNLLFKVMEPYMNMIPQLKDLYSNFKTNLALLEELDEFEDKADIIDLRSANKEISKNIFEILNEFRNEKKSYSTQELENNIKTYYSKGYKLDKKAAQTQLALLLDYIEYSNQAGNLTTFVNGIKYDNSRTKTVKDNERQKAAWQKMIKSNFIANPEALLEKTFLGEMKKEKEEVEIYMKDFLISLHPKAKPVFQPLIDRLNNTGIFAKTDDIADLLTKYQNFFISYILHTTPYTQNGEQKVIHAQYDRLMRGENSLAKRLKQLKNSDDPNISENLVIKELLPILASNVDQTDGVRLFKNRMDTYKNNILIEALENLDMYADATADVELKSFIEDLSLFVIAQSGLQEGSMNYTKILPVYMYTRLVNDILTNFVNSPVDIDAKNVWRRFHQQFKRNRSLVPKVNYFKTSKRNSNIMIDMESSDAAYDYLTRVIKAPGMKQRQIDDLIKQGRSSEAFRTIVYERMEDEIFTSKTGKVYFVYRPLNPVGKDYRFTEIYPVDQASLLPENNVIDPKTSSIIIPRPGSSARPDTVSRPRPATASRPAQEQQAGDKIEENKSRIGGNQRVPGTRPNTGLSSNSAPTSNNIPPVTADPSPAVRPRPQTGSSTQSRPRPATTNGPIYFGNQQASAKPAININDKAAKVLQIVSAPGYVKESAKKYLAKELFKIRQATQFIGTGGGNDSTTQRMENAYSQVGLANTGNYSSSDLVYVSSNGNRANRYSPFSGIPSRLQGPYQNIDKVIAARGRIIMDTAQHLTNTKSYNIGEIDLAVYLASKGYKREDSTGIWSPASSEVDDVLNKFDKGCKQQ